MSRLRIEVSVVGHVDGTRPQASFYPEQVLGGPFLTGDRLNLPTTTWVTGCIKLLRSFKLRPIEIHPGRTDATATVLRAFWIDWFLASKEVGHVRTIY